MKKSKCDRKPGTSLRSFILLSFCFIKFVVLGQSYCQEGFPYIPNSDVNSWDGLSMSPHEQYRFLNLFINIIYDQTPLANPCPNPNGVWDPASIQSINQVIPSYILGPEPDLMDPNYNQTNVHGTMTRRYHESSFGDLILLGDFVVVNVLQSYVTPAGAAGFTSHELISKALAVINISGGLQTLFSHNSIIDYDTDGDNIIDYFQVCVRNSTITYGGVSWGSGYSGYGAYPVLMNGTYYNTSVLTFQCTGNGDITLNPADIISHEFAHTLFGGNDFHTSGGTFWKYETGITFLGIQGGFGLMGGGNSGIVSCNGYDRLRMHWKSPIYNNTSEYIVANNQISDITKENGTMTFLLRDFITTGDAIRIKLPYKDANGLNQYLWLENHKIGLNNALDYLVWSNSHSCRPMGKPGVLVYYQIGKDILSGPNNMVYPGGQADNLRLLSAEGNFDYLQGSNFYSQCVGWGDKKSGIISEPNPFLGYNELMVHGHNVSESILDKDDFGFLWKKYFPDNSYNDSIPHLFDDRDMFRGNFKIGIGSNPSPFNVQTFYNKGTPSNSSISIVSSGLNNNTIYLLGLSISGVRQLNDDYQITIRWDDYLIDNNVRWTGEIVLMENAVLQQGKVLSLDQNLTPVMINRDPESGQFGKVTKFVCKDGSVFTAQNLSNINLLNKSKLILESGSIMTIEDNALLTVNSSCSMEIQECATLIVNGSGKLIIENGGTLCIKPGANIYFENPQNLELKPGYSFGNGLPITMNNFLELLNVVPTYSISTGNVTWAGKTYKLRNNLMISSGSTLNLTQGSLLFEKGCKIIVQVGGKLNITESLLSSNSCSQSSLWGGIVVYGNENEPQIPSTNQGLVQITNGIIENSVCGITTIIPIPEDNGGQTAEPTGTGGIIFANGATFRNNRIAIGFHPYSFQNRSYFNNCRFETTAELNDKSLPDYFVKLKGVSSVEFSGCQFENTQTVGSIPVEKRGNGIYAINSDVIIQSSCLDPNICPCPENQIIRNLIRNLFYGVYALSTGLNKSVIIDRSDFITNYRGMYLGALDFTTTTRNYIHPWEDQCTQNPQTYGFYFDECTGFQIEKNSFNSENTSQVGIGLIINKSGQDNNMVYDNQFSNLRFATIAQENNRGKNNDGLCYKCNDFINNLYDIKVSVSTAPLLNSFDGIAARQGANIQNNNSAPAGNTFSSGPTAYNIFNGGNGFLYYHHSNSNFYKVIPFPIGGPGLVTPWSVQNTSYSKALSCPSNLNGNGSAQEEQFLMGEAQAFQDSTLLVLESNIDEGSTSQLIIQIANSTTDQSMNLHQELLSASPFLSDSVLISAIEKEDVLPNALISNILAANPQSAKTDSLLEMLDTRSNQLPDYMMNEIMQGEVVAGEKENLEALISYWSHERFFRWGNLFRLFNHSDGSASNDSLINLLLNESTTYAKYQLAFKYINSGNYLIANSVIASIPQQFPLDAYQLFTHQVTTNYMNTYMNLINSYPISLIPDSAMVLNFIECMEATANHPAILARNVLLNAGMISHNEPIIVNDEDLKFSRKKRHSISSSSVSDINEYFKVFPNPADNYLIAETQLGNIDGTSRIELLDITGKVLSTYYPSNKTHHTIINTSNLIPGHYLVKLFMGNSIQTVKKVEIY